MHRVHFALIFPSSFSRRCLHWTTFCYVLYLHWTAFCALPTLDCVLCFTYIGLRSVLYLHWTAFCALPTLDCVLCFIYIGLRSVLYLHRTAFCALFTLDCVLCFAWRLQRFLWSDACLDWSYVLINIIQFAEGLVSMRWFISVLRISRLFHAPQTRLVLVVNWNLMEKLESNLNTNATSFVQHDDVIKWKHFPRNWPFVRGIHRSPVNSRYKGQWRGALMFSLICFWINDWINNREAGDVRRYRAHYDVIVMEN